MGVTSQLRPATRGIMHMIIRRPLDWLRRCKSGVAMTEFALGAPVLLIAGLWGAETANLVLVNMKVGQLAVQIADNASRVGDTSQLKNRKIYESDINDVLIGAQIQAGKQINIFEHGRVIISSLESQGTAGKQYIHWQRCRGANKVSSSYGNEGDGLGTTLVGMGPAGQEVIAEPGDAVIFVEINYRYQPLITDTFLGPRTINSIASFTVRDNRDLAQIYQRDPVKPEPEQKCDKFSGEIKLGVDGGLS